MKSSWSSFGKRGGVRVTPVCSNNDPQQTEFLKSINDFIASKEDPHSVLGIAYRISPRAAAALDKQLETFSRDMQRMEQGHLSYAEMRARYG